MPRKRLELMDLPPEVLHMIAERAATPLDDSTPLDQNITAGVKALSRVNRAFRAICLRTSLHHVRMWRKEDNLANHLRRIHKRGKHILHLSTSISIRSIGPERATSYLRTAADQKNDDVILKLQLVLADMPRLREVRLVADNGKNGIEPIWRKFFRPSLKRRVFPTVTSLYVRTASSMARTFRCFPNLEAVNFNLHVKDHKCPESQEFKALKKGFPRLRTVAIFKTVNHGWTVADIKATVRHFPDIERLFLEGCIGTDVSMLDPKEIAGLFAPHRNLRHLALTYELYQRINRGYCLYLKLGGGDPTLRWQQMASAFFTALPNLRELCLGRQVDFRALNTEEVKEEDDDANPAPLLPPPQARYQIVRSYTDRSGRPRLNFPPARWTGEGCIWWSAAGPVPTEADMAVPDEEKGSVKFFGLDERRGVSMIRVNYQQMVLDHCETGFWDVEWLRVIRGPRGV
ncbi:hypothetical protein C8A01DRAFT_12412 [Parachaetomium inaequale]|uniref:Uncharacterized protein n=1 Tax=Parachaetomium inaequale TaxID=2588326 RepID=A0AAN6PNM9_9PEZI|nr:hypothetical protein C8A01DRAFT_12412 [Parachaetomium inaequale]